MADEPSHDVKPAAALRRAVLGGAVAYLGSHAALRFLVGAAGAVLFLIGVLAAPAWEVPLLSWLSGGQVAAVCLAGGLGTLGIWYLAGREARSSSKGGRQESTAPAPRADLIAQLNQLHELHVRGVLTDEEFARAKARILE